MTDGEKLIVLMLADISKRLKGERAKAQPH